jgi:hypothetical protein
MKLNQKSTRLAVCAFIALTAAACADREEGASVTDSSTKLQLARFTEDEVGSQLDEGWERVAEGVFELRGEDGSVTRVSVGRAGLLSDLAREEDELEARASDLAGRAASAEEEATLRELRGRIASREGLAARKNLFALTTGCMDDEFEAEVSSVSSYFSSSANAVAHRTVAVNPPVAAKLYAYSGVYNGGWAAVANGASSVEDSAQATIGTHNFFGCSLRTIAQVAVPSCPEAYLEVSGLNTCPPVCMNCSP